MGCPLFRPGEPAEPHAVLMCRKPPWLPGLTAATACRNCVSEGACVLGSSAFRGNCAGGADREGHRSRLHAQACEKAKHMADNKQSPVTAGSGGPGVVQPGGHGRCKAGPLFGVPEQPCHFPAEKAGSGVQRSRDRTEFRKNCSQMTGAHLAAAQGLCYNNMGLCIHPIIFANRDRQGCCAATVPYTILWLINRQAESF